MDRNHIFFFFSFRALGFLFNFQIQAQQNSIALLMMMLHYQQAFLRVKVLFSGRRRRFSFRNRLRLRNPPWLWTLPCPAESWFEVHFHDKIIPEDYFRHQLRMDKNTFQALLGIHMAMDNLTEHAL